MSELKDLEAISLEFGYSRGVMAASIARAFKVMKPHLKPGSILELGPAEGLMTAMLLGAGGPVTVVEGSRAFCDQIKAAHPQVDTVHSLFEDYAPAGRFDNIILGHVLEHVVDPVALLRQAQTWLAPGGTIFAAVPNARSLHRQAAVIMGLLPSEDALNESDLQHGHRRVFTPETFRNCFYQAGLKVEVFGGYWLKPLANSQIEANWTDAMVEAFMDLGERYPDVAGEIYVVASAGERPRAHDHR
jgi:2-polyprenyl-3-methyl-5-hydroxy-6-metoxy-1,4-benzoquinol methylase